MGDDDEQLLAQMRTVNGGDSADPESLLRSLRAGTLPATNDDQRLQTTTGRHAVEGEAMQKQIAQYEESIKTATGDRLTSLQNRLAAVRKEAADNGGELNTASTLAGSAKRFLGGAAEAIPQTALGALDLVTSVPQLALDKGLSKIGINDGQVFTKAREQIHEAEAGLSDMTGAQGWEGFAGNLTGGLALGAGMTAASKIPVIGKAFQIANAPAELYSTISNATLRFLGKANILQPAMKAALEGGRLQRAAGQVLGDLPANVYQALSQPDANPHDVARTLALGAAGSLVGGSIKDKEYFNSDGSPIDPSDFSKLPKGGGNTDGGVQDQVAAVQRIKAWQDQNPGKVWSDLPDADKSAALGTDVSKVAPVEAAADAVKSYIMGDQDDVTAAQDGYIKLAKAGLDSETMTSVMGLKPIVAEGHTALIDQTGMSPDPQRLLLASGQAPRALEAAAKADANTTLYQPTTKLTDSGDTEYSWELPDGNTFMVRGQPVDGTFRVTFTGATDGEGSVGPRVLIKARQQLMDMTGTQDVAGYRVSGARPGRESGAGDQAATMPNDGVSRPVSRPPDGSPVSTPQPGEIGPQTGTKTAGPKGLETEISQLVASGNLDAMKAKWHDLEDQLVDGSPTSIATKWMEKQSNTLYQHIEALGGFTAQDYQHSSEPAVPATIPQAAPEPTGTAELSPPLAIPPSHPQELETVQTKVPLAQMGPTEIDGVMREVMRPFDSDPTLLKTPQFSAAQRDMVQLNQALKSIDAKPPESRFALEQPVNVDRLTELSAKPIANMKESERTEMNVLLQARNNKLPPNDPAKGPIIDKLMELRDFQRSRQIKEETPDPTEKPSEDEIRELFYNENLQPKKGLGRAGFTLPAAQASIVAVGAGAALGYAIPEDNSEDRIRNAFLGALVVGGALYGGKFYLEGKQRVSDLESRTKKPGEDNIRSVMSDKLNDKEHASLTMTKMSSNVLGAFERFYANTLHPSQGYERSARILGGDKLGKLVGEFGQAFSMGKREVNNWIYGGNVADAQGNKTPTGPLVMDSNGQMIPRVTQRADGTTAPVRSLSDILQSVGGDDRTLNNVAVALTAMERYKTMGKMPHPDLDPIQVAQYAASADQKFIDAARALRDVHLGMLDYQVENGLISHDARDKMASEEFYTALERTLGDTEGSTLGQDIKQKIQGIFSPTGVKSRVGPNELKIVAPVETLIKNIPRVMKAVELNKAKAAIISLYEASGIPDDVKQSIIKPVVKSQNDRAMDVQHQQLIQILKQHMPSISSDDAQGLIDSYSPSPLGRTSDFMTFRRDGKTEVWRLAPDLADSFQWMAGPEISKLWETMFGKAALASSKIARAGIINDPSFVARVSLFDMFHSFLNSNYGGQIRDYVPGVNWVEGLYKSFAKHPDYILAGGGSAAGTHFEGQPTVESIIKRAKVQGDNYMAEAWSHVKNKDLVEAYKSFLTPLSYAGKVSEYAAAMRHGATVQEAIRSSQSIVGHYNQMGSYLTGFARLVPLMRGIAQSTDRTIAASGLHPFKIYDATGQGSRASSAIRFFVKGMAAVGLPTAALYMANKDDKEIQQLRQSESGRRFWFYRQGGQIFSVRKPAGPAGALFGAGMEIALDKARGEEPEAFGQFASNMMDEMGVPYLPPALQASIGLATGTDVGTGNLLVSQGKQGLPADLQRSSSSGSFAGDLSKTIVDKLGEPQSPMMTRSISPAGIQYIGRVLGGSLGTEAFKLVDAAKDWVTDGHVPASQELPILRKFIGVDLTTAQTRDMEDFYKMVGRAETITNALSQTKDQGDIEGFISMTQRYQKDIASSSLLMKTRQQVIDIQRSVNEMKNVSGLDDQFKRDMLLSLRRQMQLLMGNAVNAARSVNEAQQ